ncbi:MAG: PIG-L family deacetylase, partial [Oscillospiraceae bacterium]|nr:PIG-L family deacetylase [Oscillospiraceae bacterium]
MNKFWLFICLEFIVAATIVCMMYGFYLRGGYSVNDTGKTALYADKNVLVLVPHQDDELIVAGGIIDEYVKYGSKVSLVFSTNGDAAIS